MYENLRDSLLLPIIHREIRELAFYNAPRTAVYRPIIRYLVVQRKMARYALPSEEVFSFLRATYPDLIELTDYTLDDCEEDLLRLAGLGRGQDGAAARTGEYNRRDPETAAEGADRRLRDGRRGGAHRH